LGNTSRETRTRRGAGGKNVGHEAPNVSEGTHLAKTSDGGGGGGGFGSGEWGLG